jgi:hypothetical protein
MLNATGTNRFFLCISCLFLVAGSNAENSTTVEGNRTLVLHFLVDQVWEARDNQLADLILEGHNFLGLCGEILFQKFVIELHHGIDTCVWSCKAARQ